MIFKCFLALISLVALTSCQDEQQLADINNSLKEYIPSTSDNTIYFDMPDLTVQYSHQNVVYQLEAFKTSANDRILEEKDPSKYGQLLWVSLGHPLIYKSTFKTEEKPQFFHFNNERFYTYLSMLETTHKQIFVDTVLQKHNVSISLSQIVLLPLSQLNCKIRFNANDGRKIIFSGEVTDFKTMPLQIDFWIPSQSSERLALIERIEKDGDKLDISLNCVASSKGKVSRVNTLKITASQWAQMDMTEKLFGPADSSFVSREQLFTLNAEIHQTLNIVEEYEMSEYEFGELFIQDLLDQTASSTLAQVSLNEAINSISSYAISFVDDLKPDIIRRDAGRILKIVEYNNKSNVVVDEEGLEYLKKSGKYSKSKYINLFDANRSVEHSREKNEEWLNSNKNHFEQLLELNSVTTDDVQWEFEGEKIVPKSLNVARLMRASFEKTLSFTRIRRQIYEADFMRTFSLYTKRSILLPTEYQLLEQKIEQISASNNMSLRLFDEKHTSNIENLAETMHGHINSEHEHFKWVFETGYIYRSTTDAENIWKFYNHQCNFDRRKILSIFYVYFIKCDFNSKFVDPPIIYTTPCLIDSDHTRNFRVNTMKGLEVTNSYFSIELNSQGHPSSGDGLVLSKICWMAIGRVL